MKSTFSTIFYLKRQAVKKDGTVPVMGRITVNGTQTQFSSKIFIDPKLWDTKSGRAIGRRAEALEANLALDKIRVKINRYYQEIVDRDNYVTAEKVKIAFLGLDNRCQTLLQVFRQHIQDYEKLYEVGMKARATLVRYQTVCKHLEEFMLFRYKVSDIALKELTPAFIADFDIFLRTEKHCCKNTVCLYLYPLKSVISIAVNNGWIGSNMFRYYEIKKEATTRDFLTKKEIRLLLDAKLKNSKHELYRDLFLFCIFTGLSFSDMRNLAEENLCTYFDKHLWISINRQKTGVQSNIRLLDIPLGILEKYRGHRPDGKIFTVPHYTVCLGGIRSVAKRCGISKHITWHVARHTMATEICLTNGVPIETVSSILGHKNIRTTQIYAKITKEKLNKDMEKLSSRLTYKAGGNLGGKSLKGNHDSRQQNVEESSSDPTLF